MKVKVSKNGTYSLTGLNEEMLLALRIVMNTANDRCFDEQDPNGNYYSNDDFVVSLSSDEREALREMCKEL